MFCGKCGFQNNDNAKFCAKCGAPMPVAETQPQDQYQAPQGGAAGVYAQTYAPRPVNGLMGELKKQFSSGLYLAIVILLSISFIISLAQGAGAANMIAGVSSLSGLGVPGLTFVSDIAVLSVIIGVIPQIVLLVGFWLIFVTAYDKSGAPMKTIGFSILHVMMVIYEVILIVVLVIAEIALIVALVQIGSIASQFGGLIDAYSAQVSAGVGMYIMMMILIAAIFVLFIIFYKKAAKSAKAVKFMVMTGRPDPAMSTYVAVMAIIMGALAFFAGIIFNPLSALVTLGLSIVVAVWMFKFRDAIKQYR